MLVFVPALSFITKPNFSMSYTKWGITIGYIVGNIYILIYFAYIQCVYKIVYKRTARLHSREFTRFFTDRSPRWRNDNIPCTCILTVGNYMIVYNIYIYVHRYVVYILLLLLPLLLYRHGLYVRARKKQWVTIYIILLLLFFTDNFFSPSPSPYFPLRIHAYLCARRSPRREL